MGDKVERKSETQSKRVLYLFKKKKKCSKYPKCVLREILTRSHCVSYRSATGPASGGRRWTASPKKRYIRGGIFRNRTPARGQEESSIRCPISRIKLFQTFHQEKFSLLRDSFRFINFSWKMEKVFEGSFFGPFPT